MGSAMINFRSICLAFSCVLVIPVFTACDIKDGVEPNSGIPATITFMHMSDLHAHLVPHEDVIRDPKTNTPQVVERGGVARLATVVKEIRASNPDSVLMNIGDTFHGGVEARFSKGNAIVRPVNSLGIDVGVPGNWDFAFDPMTFMQRFGNLNNDATEKPTYRNLSANLKSFIGTPIMDGTWLTNIGGVRVGFIGLTSDMVPLMHPVLGAGFQFVTGEENYKNLVNRLAAALRGREARIVVVMSEIGLHKNYRLAQVLEPGAVDVIFSAHTHEITQQPLTSTSGALVVEAGNDGYLGRMDISVDAQGAITNRQWSIRTIDASVAEDAQMQALIDQERARFIGPEVNIKEPILASNQRLTLSIDQVVGHTDVLLSRRHALENTFNNTFTDMIRAATGTQVAMTPGFRFDAVIPQTGLLLEDNTVATGDITVEDVFRFFPVHFTMGQAYASGAHVKETLEEGMTRTFASQSFDQAGGWFSGLSGLDLTVDLTAPDGQRITQMRLSDTAELITDTTVLSVAGCIRPLELSDRLCSFPGFRQYVSLINPATNAAYTGADFFIDALKNGAVNTTRSNIVDLSNTRIWPSADAYQPIGFAP